MKARGWCQAHYLRWYKTGDPERIRPGRWDGYERPVCSVADCDRPAHARGWCTIHGPRVRRHGDPTEGRRSNWVGTLAAKFDAMWEADDDGCWIWLAAKSSGGYGEIGDGRYAHRVAVELDGRAIPDGFHVHHTCEVRACVNPEHLEVVTPKEHRARHRAEFL